ncbi:putative dipeptidase [Trichinella pseudospiralis]
MVKFVYAWTEAEYLLYREAGYLHLEIGTSLSYITYTKPEMKEAEYLLYHEARYLHLKIGNVLSGICYAEPEMKGGNIQKCRRVLFKKWKRMRLIRNSNALHLNSRFLKAFVSQSEMWRGNLQESEGLARRMPVILLFIA